MRFTAAILLNFILLNVQGLFAQQNEGSINASLAWDTQNELPILKEGKEQLGLAGAVIGISNNRLIVAGGANFPNGFPWKGGKKVFQQDIYIAKIGEKNQLEWEFTKPLLPYPIAYSANVPFQNGFISVGGEDFTGALPYVSYWLWNEENGNLIENKFPDLPTSLTNTAAAILNNRLYVMGGENQDGPSGAVWFLDLAQKEKGWQNGPSLPLATSHASAVVQTDGQARQLFLIGGRAKTPSGVSDLYNQVICLNIKEQKWLNKSPITLNKQAISALSAASAVAWGSTHIIVFGGDDGQVFHQIETYDQKIHGYQREEEKSALILLKNELIENHKGFNKGVILYNTVTDSWTKLGELPYSPVTTTALYWQNRIIIPSGEIQPGIRTPIILIGTTQSHSLQNEMN